MINKKLKEHLLKRAETSDLAFSDLISYLENSQFDFIGGELMGVLGLATEGKAFFDLDGLEESDDQKVFFVVLHEYAHVLKIHKMGKAAMITHLSVDDFDEFLDHIVNEEILADRYGSLLYRIFNKEDYPRYRTQCLEKEHRKDLYAYNVRDLHGKIKDEESYDKLLNSFVLDGMD